MQCGESIAVIFIDYSAAFDTISHKFLDKALEEVGMSNTVRAMFKAVYKNAEAFTTVQGAKKETVSSKTFPIRRGVQGDITSPLCVLSLRWTRFSEIMTAEGTRQ